MPVRLTEAGKCDASRSGQASVPISGGRGRQTGPLPGKAAESAGGGAEEWSSHAQAGDAVLMRRSTHPVRQRANPGSTGSGATSIAFTFAVVPVVPRGQVEEPFSTSVLVGAEHLAAVARREGLIDA